MPAGRLHTHRPLRSHNILYSPYISVNAMCNTVALQRCQQGDDTHTVRSVRITSYILRTFQSMRYVILLPYRDASREIAHTHRPFRSHNILYSPYISDVHAVCNTVALQRCQQGDDTHTVRSVRITSYILRTFQSMRYVILLPYRDASREIAHTHRPFRSHNILYSPYISVHAVCNTVALQRCQQGDDTHAPSVPFA